MFQDRLPLRIADGPVHASDFMGRHSGSLCKRDFRYIGKDFHRRFFLTDQFFIAQKMTMRIVLGEIEEAFRIAFPFADLCFQGRIPSRGTAFSNEFVATAVFDLREFRFVGAQNFAAENFLVMSLSVR